MGRVLFLDIDGVLNDDVWFGTLEKRVARMQYERGLAMSEVLDEAMINPELAKLVSEFVEEHDISVVLSSVWRFHNGVKELLENVFNIPVLDETPELWNQVRGNEIALWLARNADTTEFVILDDDADMSTLMDHLVQTDNVIGVTKDDVERMKLVLKL